jgi:hypothetical protein
MRQAADVAWSGLQTAGAAIDTLSKSEQHASHVLTQFQKSGRDLWNYVQDVGTKDANALTQIPTIVIQ